MTPEELLHDYHERVNIYEFDGGLEHTEAERRARADIYGAEQLRLEETT